LGEDGKTIVKTITEWLGLNRHSHSGMILSENGNIKPILANAITMLETVPCWKEVLAFNELTMLPVKLKPAPWENRQGVTPWTDHDDTKLAEWFERHGLFIDSSKRAGEAAQAVARENSFHPVRDYLNSLTWDGTARLDSWLPTYLGTPKNDYTSAAGRCWLISGAARIYRPGSKVDYTLVLEGPQGKLKSTALDILAGDGFFLDDFADFDNKDALLKMHGAWVVEMAELTPIRRGGIDRVKAFLTSKDDVFRAPYDRRPQHHPRTCIFAASTNDSTPFTDETGNRRFWPIKCGRIALDKLRADRDQLWAEAVARFEKGEKWWFESQAAARGPYGPEMDGSGRRSRFASGEQDSARHDSANRSRDPRDRTDARRRHNGLADVLHRRRSPHASPARISGARLDLSDDLGRRSKQFHARGRERERLVCRAGCAEAERLHHPRREGSGNKPPRT
jgi:hypothetical protein